MTDTRKEFEEWFESQYGKKPMPSPKNGDEPHTNTYMTMFADGANKGWQACQSLNDKRIQQLLAVIEKKDEALKLLLEFKGMIEERSGDYETNKASEALAIKPGDVELVEVGELNVVGNEVGTGCIPYIQITNHSNLGKLYTIKTKE